ncbi:O-succinylhomoserine sulfhydrylase [Thiomonas sp.]|uniref:O-succinylhomoserine sulfhydrylase n=1 Tax=Thiomonas sp. TaxID=2047785 RepID=UPI0026262C25|nr:O-succinylhomoserine sulfhydrylase [Thiomonas sp.]
MSDDGLPRNEALGLQTLAVREALPRSQYGEHSEALFLTSSFVHPDAQTAARRFAGDEEGFLYSRFSNPTVASYEQRLAALEGTQACMATGSGMAAILLLAMALLKAGDHVICSQGVFGSTVNLFGRELARFGVQTTFVPQTDVAQWAAALRPNTRLLFAETPSNPLTEVCDIAALAELAHGAGAELAVDNCFCSPALQRPADFGADWVVHSGTKYLDGQGRVIAGAVCGRAAPIRDKLLPVQRTVGMSLSPFNAWVVLKGMETLGVRMAAHSAAALSMAQWLQAHPAVGRVFYPGLPSHPQHALAMRQQKAGGAVLSFELRADDAQQARQRAFHVIDHTRICSITANLGDTKTTITHPATTTHGRLREEQRQAAGIGQGLIRLAVGLENIDDLQRDLARGLDSLG